MVQAADELNQLIVSESMRISGDIASGPIIEVAHGGHHASISLFGAQVLHWRPAGHAPVLWLSDDAQFDQELPIRGGIPLCWPWFAGHPQHSDWPTHGFARTSRWYLDFATATPEEAILELSLPREDWHASFWPHMSRPVVKFLIGETLSIEFSIENTDPHEIVFTEAMHMYFAVGRIDDASIHGLETVPFVDKTAADSSRQVCDPEQRPLTIEGEVDRVYHDLVGPIDLHDGRLARTVRISYFNAENVIVWNPWIAKSARMGDMGSFDAYRGMVCVETGNVMSNLVRLGAGEIHTLATQIEVHKDA